MRLNPNRILTALSAILLAMGLLGTRVAAETFNYTFPFQVGQTPPNTVFLGSARTATTNNQVHLSLTEATTSQRGTWILSGIAPGRRITRLEARFEVNINQALGRSSYADGISFNFAPNLRDDLIGEDGTTNGLAISVDTFDNGGTDTAPSIECIYGGVAMGGTLFDGVRSSNNGRDRRWSRVEPWRTLNTETRFVPVVVTLLHDESTGNSFTSVRWDGILVVDTVQVPYTPASGWQIAFGARTGASFETHYLRNVAIEAETRVQLTVASAYGAGMVQPPVGTRLVGPNSEQIVTAPRFVYLDRFHRELGGEEAATNSLARYRARLVGSDENGRPGPTYVGTVVADRDVTLTWNWELENLAEINTGTEGITGLSPSDVTDPVHVPHLGRHYRSLADTGFDSVVRRSVSGEGIPVRFAAKGFVVENVPNSSDRYLELTGEGDHFRGARPFTKPMTGADGSFTVEFWTRRNAGVSANHQTVFSLGSVRSPPQQFRVGFAPDRSFFASDGTRTASAPASLTDAAWHHWAVVNDRAANEIRIFRDGRRFVASGPALGILNTDGVVCIGATADGQGSLDPFSGGINNLRVWPSALAETTIRSSMETSSQPGPSGDLAFQFEGDPQVGSSVQGVMVEQRSAGLNEGSDISSWRLDRTWVRTNGLTVPLIAEVPMPLAGSQDRFLGWIARSVLTIPTSGTYRFVMTSSGWSQLRVGGQMVIANDVANDLPSGFRGEGSVTLSAGTHLLEARMMDPTTGPLFNPERRLNIQYESLPNLSLTNLPAASLALTADDLLTSDRLELGTDGPRTLAFKPRGFDRLMDSSETIETLRSILLPGFLAGFESSFGQNSVGIPQEARTPLNDWRRVFWLWEKQHRMEIYVTSDDPGGIDAVRRLPYLGGGVQVDGASAGGSSTIGQDVIKALDVWVGDGLPLWVGTVYRTPDRRFMLSSISGNLNLFGEISTKTLQDGTYRGAVSRQHPFDAVNGPGALTFNYSRTLHRVALGIGESLDVSSLANTTTALFPDLPTGVVDLRITSDGPSVEESSVSTTEGGKGGTGTGWQWDAVGRRWFPLRPGRFTLKWPDRNGYTNTIEVTANFPNEVQSLQDWERKDGSRHGTFPDHSLEFRFPAVGAPFPGAPGAHYPYAVSPNSNRPYPGDLDPSTEDRWKFLRLAFSEQRTATVRDDRILTEQTPGIRSVLVYSQRATNAGAATGDLTRETVLVRVLQSNSDRANEVATVGQRVLSPRDLGGFHSGYVVWERSNHNPEAYNAEADPGRWGPVFPVNSHIVQPLSLGWYDNPSRFQDPPGALPTVTVNYTEVRWPNPATADVIYIASRMGTEGVGQDVATQRPNYQVLFNPDRFADLSVYNQPDRGRDGFNPNEEHAFVERSIAFELTGDPRFKQNQQAVYALQHRINRTDSSQPSQFTSEPWVLVQFRDPDPVLNPRRELSMRVYRVLPTRQNATSVAFPALDTTTRTPLDPAGNPVQQPANPTYGFSYSGFAGSLVVPPYPLGRVIGNLTMTNTTGGNIAANPGSLRRTLWFDRNRQTWIVSGDGRFFQRFWYPLREDFWFGEPAERPMNGTEIAWNPAVSIPGSLASFTANGTPPVAALYDTFWRPDHPVLKRGETLTFQGGESKADTPSRPGLPSLVSWASGEIVFDSAVPSMAFTTNNALQASTFLMRPLDRLRQPIAQGSMPQELQPRNTAKVMVSNGRWHFKDLPASLGGRFYYDPLSGELVFRGRLNGRESGAPDLTVPPLEPHTLEPNVLGPGDLDAVLNLAPGSQAWRGAVTALFNQIPATPGFTTEPPSGPAVPFFRLDANAMPIGLTQPTSTLFPMRSLGTGAALVPSGVFLSRPPDGQSRYVTLVENNNPKAGGAVSLHVIRIGDERFRGSVAVIPPPNLFDEKIELQHTADFGGSTANVYYQWWIRDVAALEAVGTPDSGASGWQLYQQGLGLSRIRFSGRPDITLADKFFYVRYGGSNELATIDPRNRVPNGSVVDSSWRLVSPDALSPDWNAGGTNRVPFQWAGAANSPQLQADGSRRFLPQLVMGWVKRVLDQINPFEARFKENFSGDAPATFSSLLQQAGRPYVGPVALNSEKDALERVGLIELYETVLQRAKDLTLNQPSSGTDQAILLAATRLAVLYDLLGAEAYSDAQNPAIPLTDPNGNPIQSFAAPYAARTFLFAFDNQVPSLLEEELALLRGTDFLKSYPVFNRLFWNYTRGLGEAAYNINYHIQDITKNGVIDTDDASKLYPMGHGDAWGHHLSALKMHYDLLRRPGFRWEARSEYYSLLGNVVPTDYLDEKSFAKSAARRALTGISVIKSTYRSAYVADPAGQWQGYTDLADPARAWGISEWAGRVGHGALFDWVVANAITPPKETTQSTNPVVDLNRIDRSINRAEIGLVSSTMTELDIALANINRGQNPLGFDDQAMAFDASPQSDATPFEQVLARAISAGDNAQTALDFATRIDQSLRNISSETAGLERQTILQDFDYRNRLIGLLGTPYEGTIGPGGLFREGYEGPDLITYLYVPEADVQRVLPQLPAAYDRIQERIQILSSTGISDWSIGGGAAPRFDRANLSKYFEDFYLTRKYPTTIVLGAEANDTDGTSVLRTSLPYQTTAQYGLTAPAEWGRRRAPGAIQEAIQEMLAAEIELQFALDDYRTYFKDLDKAVAVAEQRVTDFKEAARHRGFYYQNLQGIKGSITAFESLKEILTDLTAPVSEDALKAKLEFLPKSVGVLGGIDAFFPARGAGNTAAWVSKALLGGVLAATEATRLALKQVEVNYELKQENGAAVAEEFGAFMDMLVELSGKFSDESSKRLAIAGPLNRVNMAADRIRAVQAEALRLQQERTAYNMQVAATAQRNRYEDIAARMSRNEAARQYDASLENALRYAFLALRAYDYETSLSEDHPASAQSLYDTLMQTRQLGLWTEGKPQIGNGGLAEILDKLRENHRVLKNQIGLESPQMETATFSLRTELFRISKAAGGDGEWKRQLGSQKIANLWELPEFAAYCRPFSRPEDGPQPAFVIEFPTTITLGRNFFGNALRAGDRAFSTAEYATKIKSHAIAFPGYDRLLQPQLSSSPRVYLVPVGMDRQRTSDSRYPEVREWKVISQRIPTPFVINPGQLAAAEPISGQRGVDGSFVDRIRFSDFRAFTESIGGPDGADPWNDADAAAATSSRLYGRSVWNTRWLLIIPGANLGPNPETALQRFVDTVKDIEVQFQTYSNPGM